MKITSVEVYMGYAITVKINTDEGIIGFGEAGLSYGNSREAAFGQCQDYAKMVIGMNPMNTEEIWDHLHRHSFWGMGGGAVVMAGISAIDTACWDIKGKKLGVPVYQLLGGKTNKKLRTYASQLQFGWRNSNKNELLGLGLLYKPEEYYDVVKKAMADGYDAVKIDPVFAPANPLADPGTIFKDQGCHYRGSLRQHDLKMAVDRIAAAREAGGPDLDIIVEIHSLLDANTATELGKALEPYHIMYYEEPTQPMNPALFKFIKEHTSLPLATGERCYSRWAFRQFFEDRTLSIIQPDLCNTGGITETKKICDMAHVYDIGVQIHVCGGPIATAAALQVEAVIPNFCIHEHHVGALQKTCIESCVYDYQPVNGFFEVPEKPGIGQEMSEHEMKTARKVVIQ
jgi:galactonate dehydratase